MQGQPDSRQADLGDLHLGLHPLAAVPGHPAGEVVCAVVPGRRPGDRPGDGGGGRQADAGGVRGLVHLHQVMARGPGEGDISSWGIDFISLCEFPCTAVWRLNLG